MLIINLCNNPAIAGTSYLQIDNWPVYDTSFLIIHLDSVIALAQIPNYIFIYNVLSFCIYKWNSIFNFIPSFQLEIIFFFSSLSVAVSISNVD